MTIGGCRTYNNYTRLKTTIDKIISQLGNDTEIVILSGHCKGVDMLAEQYAYDNGYTLEIYKADWNKYGKSAGPIRNEMMIKSSDYIVAFWDKKSKGTKNLIELAKKYKKPYTIEYIKPPE